MSSTTMIQVRNVPRELHRELKARAAREGITLSALILRELRNLAAVPPQTELFEYFRTHPLPEMKPSPAQIIRKMRGKI
ncbi:MAG: hypothetical protein EPN33_11465 [Acidobacteria bacterium]|nr:MAG: hypothetical protein EPN33_11465 [Acidobacteriota bacterium]